MKNYRYGKFNFIDYHMSWVAIAILLFFSIASAILELPILLVFFPVIYAIVWLYVILAPHREMFSLCDNCITVFFGKTTNTISLPPELTLVVSYADISPPLTVRTAVGNKTHILKDKYAVSILHKMPLDTVLDVLHRNHMTKHTMSSIRNVFKDYRYIYSFVCSQSLLEELIEGRECLLIIPKSLLNVVSADGKIVDTYIDEKC